jgi:hypothetical protein
MVIVHRLEINSELNSSEITMAVRKFQDSTKYAPLDAVIGGTRYESCVEFVKQTMLARFYVRAMLFTICVTDSRFLMELGPGASFIMGSSPWSETSTVPGVLTGWSAQDFVEK